MICCGFAASALTRLSRQKSHGQPNGLRRICSESDWSESKSSRLEGIQSFMENGWAGAVALPPFSFMGITMFSPRLKQTDGKVNRSNRVNEMDSSSREGLLTIRGRLLFI